MKLRLIFVTITLFILSSCLTTTTFRKEPLNNQDTLVIGRVLFHNTDTRPGKVPMGKYYYGVDLVFKDLNNRRHKYISTVDSKGFFYFYNPNFTHFELKEIKYKTSLVQGDYHNKERNKQIKKKIKMAKASFKVSRSSNIWYEIEPNMVNNLGFIYWEGDTDSNRHNIEFNRDYDETKAEFIKRYPESLWNNAEWLDVRANKTSVPFSHQLIDSVVEGVVHKAIDKL